MGCDIHVFAVRKGSIELEQPEEVWDDRNYGAFGWLSGVRNYSDVPVSNLAHRGLPPEFKDHEEFQHLHSFTHFILQELANQDYSKLITDHRPDVPREMSLSTFLGTYWAKGYNKLFWEYSPEDTIIIGYDS